VRVSHRDGGREQSAERGCRQQNGPREQIHITAWTGEVEQLQRLGGAGDAPFQQREDLQIAAACTVEDRADLLGELCRTGPVGAGVLLGRKGVAFSRPDRAVGQTDLDARDALIDTDADSKQAQRLDDVWDRRDRWQCSCSVAPTATDATPSPPLPARSLLSWRVLVRLRG